MIKTSIFEAYDHIYALRARRNGGTMPTEYRGTASTGYEIREGYNGAFYVEGARFESYDAARRYAERI